MDQSDMTDTSTDFLQKHVIFHFNDDCMEAKKYISENMMKFNKNVRKLMRKVRENTSAERKFAFVDKEYQMKLVENDDLLYYVENITSKCKWATLPFICLQISRTLPDKNVDNNADTNIGATPVKEQVSNALNNLSCTETKVHEFKPALTLNTVHDLPIKSVSKVKIVKTTPIRYLKHLDKVIDAVVSSPLSTFSNKKNISAQFKIESPLAKVNEVSMQNFEDFKAALELVPLTKKRSSNNDKSQMQLNGKKFKPKESN